MSAKESALNLRKSNFSFGNDAVNYESTYQNRFENGLDAVAYVEEKKNIEKKDGRKTNIKLNNDKGQQDHYMSTAKQNFNYVPTDPLKLSDDKIKEISASHTVFGYDFTNRFQSEANNNYGQKEFDPEVFQDKQELANSLRKHAYTFGEGKNYYNTTYKTNLCQIQNKDAAENHKYMKEISKESNKNLRETHLIMGFQNNFEQNKYEQKNFNQYGAFSDRVININYGQDKVDYQTMHSKMYTGQPGEPVLDTKGNFLIQELVQDLRKAHFPMGYDSINYNSEQKDHYYEKQFEKNDVKVMKRQTNIRFGDKNNYETINKTYYPQKTTVIDKPIINKKRNIALGFDQNNWESENHCQFEQKKIQTERIGNPYNRTNVTQDVNHLKDDWNSMMKQDYPNHGGQIPNTLDPALKKDIRVQHFNYGNQKDQNIATQRQYGENIQQRTTQEYKEAENIKSHLKKTNIHLGDTKNDYLTYYTNQFSQIAQ